MHAGEEFNTGRTEPLIDRETYERTLALFEARKPGELPGRPSQRPIPAGLVWGTCGSRLYAQRSSKEGVPYYACGSRTSGGLCPRGPYIRESVLVASVEPLLLRRLGRMTVRARKRDRPPDISPPRAEEEALEISLARLAALYGEGSLPEGEYRRAAEMQRRKLHRVGEQLKAKVAKLEGASLREALEPVKLTKELWDAMSVEAQQAFYQMAVDKIMINPEPQKPRIQVFWR